MNNFKRVSAAVLAGMTLMLASGASHGLGFGRPNSHAILGDTLWITVPLRLEPGEEIANECLAADVYFGEDKVAGSAISAVVLSGHASEYTLKVSTTALINEPVVTVYLAAGCKARITRKFVALADPPGMTMPNMAQGQPDEVEQAIAAATVPAPGVVSQPSALSAAMPVRRLRGAASGGTTRKADQVFSRAPSLALASTRVSSESSLVAKAAGKGEKRQPKGRAAAVAKTTVPVETGRLVLDPVEADTMVIPELRMAATLAAPAQADGASPDVLARREAAAALWLAMNASPEKMVQDRARLQELEQRLAQLKQEGTGAQNTVAALQARVQQAESGSSKWLLILGLSTLGALALAAYLFRQLRQHQKQSDAWWQSQPDAQQVEPGSNDEPDLSATSAEFVHTPSRNELLADEAEAATTFRSAVHADIHHLVPDAPPAAIGAAPTAPTAITVRHDEPLREVSVEELIDLEQQAEFFVVLGQDEAAIDLLEGHVHSTTGASPLPFLKLLEIYRRVGKRSAYDRVQAEFNKRFNAYAPAWDSDFQQGHTLSDYPEVVARLQDLWPSPFKSMEVLEKSLTHPESGEDTFELPAYRELLFLYAVARDLSEREVQDRTSVDLLLPVVDLSANEPAASVHADSVAPLMATRPIKALPEARPSMSLDLHLDDLASPEPPPKP